MLRQRQWVLLAGLAVISGACAGRSVVGGPGDDAGSPADLGTDLGVDVGTDLGPSDTGLDVAPDVSSDVGPDIPTDTGPARCTADGDCTNNPGGPVCDTTSGRCVPCTPTADRCPTGQYCTADNACAAGCRDDSACVGDAGMGGRCDTTTRQCVQCVTSDQCAAGTVCVGNVCVMGCSSARPCPAGETCCDAACVDTQSNIASCGTCGNRCNVPNAMATCSNGVCAVGTCTAPNADCDNTPGNGCEVNTQTEVAHCGGCGMACATRPNATARCAAGQCAYTCAAGFDDCDGDPSNGCEANLNEDTTRCGACGTRCDLANATAACSMGRCTVAMCTTGFGDCDGNAANGCETLTSTSVSHCGACGTVCAGADNAVPACVNGACALTCTAGFSDCDGSRDNGCEANTTSSTEHCGGCGRTCNLANSTAACMASRCTVAMCNAGFADCDANADNGCEANTNTSAIHCGACGTTCSFANAGGVCSGGTCALGQCNQGFGNCDGNAANGCETDTRTTTSHCGACGTACNFANAAATCAAGSCVLGACATGFGNCDNNAVNGCETNTQSSNAHCGACGTVCGSATTCVAGSCQPLASCAALHTAFPSLANGVYRIDPDGSGPGAVVEVFCDMTVEGGGWTLLATVFNSTGTDTRRWNTDTVFMDNTTFGTVTARNTDDYKSPAYTTVTGRSLLVQTDEYYFGFNNLAPSPMSFGAYVNSQVTPNCSTTWLRSGVDFASTNLTSDQRSVLGFAVRGHDFNGGAIVGGGGCAMRGTNENSFLNFVAGPSWWVFGVGNCITCDTRWSAYDNGMLNRAAITSAACTANAWPCNANGRWWSSTLYPVDATTKTRYVQFLVR